MSPLDTILGRVEALRRSGNGWTARCPAHEDRSPSLSIAEGHDGQVLLHCHAGCDSGAVVEALGLSWGDLFPEAGNGFPLQERRIAATYDYVDEEGDLLFQVVRFEPKDFRQRRPDGRGGWEWKLQGTRRVIYRLPEVLQAVEAGRCIFIVEGEKDADRLASLDLCGTTCPQGAGKWRPEYSVALEGAVVAILPDNDEPGRAHAEEVAASLQGKARSVRILHLPDLPEKGDVSDWLEAGGTVEDLRQVYRETPEWEPGDPCLDTAPPSTADRGEDEPRARVLNLADVEPQPVRWLWTGRIPLGKLTILDGDPGLGKSALTLDLTARVTTGAAMPDETVPDLDGPSGVVLLSAEDDPADTIRPRLDAAGGDASRVRLLQGITTWTDEGERVLRPPTLQDLHALREAVEAAGARLVVLDPIAAYWGKQNAHRDGDVRAALGPLAQLAAETGAAILAVRHLRKTGAASPTYRGGGSIGIIGAARAAWLVAADPHDQDGERRVLAFVKGNLASPAASLAFRLAVEKGAVRVEWLGESPHTSRSLLAAAGEDEEDRGMLRDAEEVLHEILARGPVAVKEVLHEAKAAGVSERTLRRAKSSLQVQSSKRGFEGPWEWSLPSELRNDGARATTKAANKTKVGNLQGKAKENGPKARSNDPIPRRLPTRGSLAVFGCGDGPRSGRSDSKPTLSWGLDLIPAVEGAAWDLIDEVLRGADDPPPTELVEDALDAVVGEIEAGRLPPPREWVARGSA